MRNDIYLKTGGIFFGIAILGIGIMQLVFHDFPAGLLPVIQSLPGRNLWVDISGITMAGAGLLILSQKYTGYGALLAGLIFLVFLLLLHIPKLIMHPEISSEWTFGFEVFMLFSGALTLAGLVSPLANYKNIPAKLIVSGKYIFAVSLMVFAVLHYLFVSEVLTFIPGWIPWPLFWAYFVTCAFFAASVSLFIQIQVRLSQTLVGLMFFLWVCMLHLPVVIANRHDEPNWTNLFVPLAMSGIGLLIAGSTTSGRSRHKL